LAGPKGLKATKIAGTDPDVVDDFPSLLLHAIASWMS
jgi:hypothetical protein